MDLLLKGQMHISLNVSVNNVTLILVIYQIKLKYIAKFNLIVHKIDERD